MSEIAQRFRQMLSIGNSHSNIMLVNLEPWGGDYWLLPGEILSIKVESESGNFWHHVEFDKELASVFIDREFENVLVMQNDEILESGHNRPESGFGKWSSAKAKKL